MYWLCHFSPIKRREGLQLCFSARFTVYWRGTSRSSDVTDAQGLGWCRSHSADSAQQSDTVCNKLLNTNKCGTVECDFEKLFLIPLPNFLSCVSGRETDELHGAFQPKVKMEKGEIHYLSSSHNTSSASQNCWFHCWNHWCQWEWVGLQWITDKFFSHAAHRCRPPQFSCQWNNPN